MHIQGNSTTGFRHRALIGAVVALLAPPSAWCVGQTAPDQTARAAVAVAEPDPDAWLSRGFSVINLSPDARAPAYLNERGQAAFNVIGSTTSGGFFDGERVYDIGSLSGNYTWIQGVNNQGVVVGESETIKDGRKVLAFAWTLAGGMRALPGAGGVQSSARGVNDGNTIVGWVRTAGIHERALRWNPDGTVTTLGPAPATMAEAYAINDGDTATGTADVSGGELHATLWDRNGEQADLGTLGGGRAIGTHINKRDDVAGESEGADGARHGFFWSRGSGMVPINVADAGARLVADLNDRGEVVGVTDIAGRASAYQWSLGSGVVTLPAGAATRSDVFDINNRGEMVGALERSAAEGGGPRAVRWSSRAAAPVDLNKILYRPPAGLVLQAAIRLNDNGVMLAYSNAGLVLLRPGRQGTGAPVLGPISGAGDSVEVGQDLALTVGFVDNAVAQTHTASVTSTDGCPSTAPNVSQANGVGQARLRHQFCTAGFHTVKVRVTGSAGRYTDVQRNFMVR